MPWVPIFDDSFQRVPVRNYPAMYAAGYRVMAGYVAGGTGDKWVTAAEIRAWLACGPDTGFLPLFEAVGDEPVTSPSSGRAHAIAARAGARARGVSDTSAISPAMDRDVSMAQAKGSIATYMRLWKSADMLPPMPYIELDAGAYLFAEHLTVGTGTPAAFEWDPSRHLITPDNAPPHVQWTQERNGVNAHGGNFDSGHIRTSAPIYWSHTLSPEDDMPTAEDIVTALLSARIDNIAPPASPTAPATLGQVLRMDYFRTSWLGLTFGPAVLAKLGALDPATLAAAIADKMPTVDKATLEAAIVGALTEMAGDEPAPVTK